MDESSSPMNETDALRESVTIKTLVRQITNLPSPSPEQYQSANDFLDNLKLNNPAAYEQRLGLDNSAQELVVEIGVERASKIVEELNHEKKIIADKFRDNSVGIDDSGVAGLAINNLSRRPTYSSVTFEQWGKLFSYNIASARLAESVPPSKN